MKDVSNELSNLHSCEKPQDPTRRDFVNKMGIALAGAYFTSGITCAHSFSTPLPLSKADMVKRGQQIRDMQFGMFICWSFSTFSGYEWTPGVTDISFFNPTGFDPEQWASTAKAAGMKYILFLTKHHDGFCLWDTNTTNRKVSNTPALKGRDVLDEVRQACQRHGLKLALYFSEGDWSWNPEHPNKFNNESSNPKVKRAQLEELLTQYGPIDFIWFDTAVGDGGLSHADTATFCKNLQPGCLIGFNHGDKTGANIRLGERGSAAPIENEQFLAAEFTYPMLEGQERAQLRGAQWFYSLPENDNKACSPEKIYRDWQAAVKHGNIFSVNIGPDRSGKVRAIDVKHLKQVGRWIRDEEQR